jgi:glycosyltransferase involved in cell wall biosynthesis
MLLAPALDSSRNCESGPGLPAETEAAVEVSIVLPCRNEAGRIGECVRDARETLERCGYEGEVIVIDGGSTDSSAQEASRAGARVLRQPIHGYGAACLRGIEAARGEFVVLVDGDGTYEIGALHRFVEPLRAGYEMVLGTRRNGDMQPGSMRSGHRHLLEPLQTQLARRFLPFPVSDVRCGMRAFTREAASRLNVGAATGMEFSSEMLVEAARAGLSTVEVPVRFRPRPDQQPRRSAGDGWRVARALLLLSPTRLFVRPGLLCLAIGLLLELALLAGPLRLGPVQLDYHFMFVGGALAILGLQLVLLGLYASTYTMVQDGRAESGFARFHLLYTLERGVVAGGLVFAAGLAVNAWILVEWVAAGSGMLFAVRPAVLALTLMVLGAEIVFAAFFLTLLRGSEFGRA